MTPERRTAGDSRAPGASVDGWRRVHPATVLLRLWSVVLAVVGALLVNTLAQLREGTEFLAERVGWLAIVGSLAAIPVFLLLAWLATLPWWRATTFRLTDEQVELRHGIVRRALRTARFDRVQAVDVVEPLIARPFRLASVRIETAGGGDSAVGIEFLPVRRAEALREEILATAASAPRTPTEDPPDGNELIPEIPLGRYLAAAILDPAAIGAIVLAVAAVLFPPAAAGILPPLVAALPWVYGVLNRSWRYRATLGDGALSMGYGLTERRRQTVPLDRIHAVEVRQPVLWRLVGWWSVRVDVAGYREKQGDTSTIVLPVGTLEDALRVFAAIGPLSRREIDASARPEGRTAADFVSPESAFFVSPLDLRRQGVTLVGDGRSEPRAVVTHRGRLGRAVAAIDPAHIQELTVRRGPVQRALGVATVVLDLVPGPVGMAGRDLEPAEADRLLAVLRRRRLPPLETTAAPGVTPSEG